MVVEKIERNGLVYAIVVRHGSMGVKRNTFFTADEMPLQVGLIAHEKGYIERVHYHPKARRAIMQTWQTLHMLKGIVEVNFYDNKGVRFKSIRIKAGDLILLMDGAHNIKAITDFLGESVKQGPYMGKKDKVEFD